MKKSIITFACFLLGLISFSTSAQVISVGAGTDFSIGSGTVLSADSLDITPSANFIFNGCSMVRSVVANNSTTIPYIKKVYQFSNTTNAFSGALKMFYSNANLNGLTESGLKFLIHNGSSWSLDNNSSVNTANKFVQNNAVNGVTLKELTAATCTPTSSINTKTACGSYIWHGTTYTSSNNTATWTGTNAAGCDSVVTLNLTITPLPATPVVNVFNNCNGTSTLSTTASGTLLWSTVAISSSIIVSNAGTYTVTQTVNGCASEAGFGIAAPKTTPPTPIVNVVNNCNGTSTLSTIPSSPGSLLLWNIESTSYSLTVSSAGTYSVRQMVDGCISESGFGTASPKTTPTAPVVNVVNNCNGTSTLSTTATGTLLWITGAITSSIIVSTAGTYTVTQTVDGCASEAGSGVAAPETSNTSTTTETACRSYTWSVNGQAYTTSGTYTSVNGCATSILNLTILPSASVTITSNPSIICSGTAVTFTATPTNGGTNPIYQWKLNGNNIGTNSTTYTNNNLSSIDVVTVEMTASNVSDVIIGSQIWTSKNLEVTTYRNGDPITKVTNATQWLGMTTGAYCYLNYDSANNSKYGKLYNWYAVNDSRGLAPLGYHIPTTNEIDIFKSSVNYNAKSIMSTTDWVDFSGNDASGTNTTGFNALPSGGHGSGGSGYFVNMMGIFWGSEASESSAYFYGCFSLDSYISGGFESKRNGYPVRLISEGTTVVSNNICTAPVTSNAVIVSVTPSTSNTTTASSCDSYTWSVSGQTYTASGSYTSVSGCATEILNLTILPSANVTISSNQSSICAGAAVTSTATPTNGGTNPNYQWKLNGNNVGTNSATYTNSNLSSTDVLTVELTPNNIGDVVTIGSQVWTSKNLDVSTYQNGDLIPHVTNPTTWNSLTTGAYTYYNNDSATYAAKYGKLYNWYAVTDPRGLAPEGYHIPSKAEWETMIAVLAPNSTPQLQSTSGWQNGNGTNSSGFYGLPSGGFDGGGYMEGYWGLWWTTDVHPLYNEYAWMAILDPNSTNLFVDYDKKTRGEAVRCISNSNVNNSNLCTTTVSSNSLIITISPSTTDTTTESACDSYTWSVNGETYTTSGTYTSVILCATKILNLTINHPSTSIETISSSSPVTWHGVIYSTSTNSPTWITTNSNGCDSIVTLHLTITCTPTSSTETISACSSYLWHGVTYTASNNTATWRTLNAGGCDSLVTLNLTIVKLIPAAPTAMTQTLVSNLCGQRVYRYTVTAVTNASGYTWSLPSSVGGVSGVTLDSGDISNSRIIRVKYASNAAALTTDSIKVRAFSTCGNSNYKGFKLNNALLNVPAAPTVTAIAVQTNVCGARKYRYRASALPAASTTVGSATGWLWSLPEGSVGSTGTIDSGDVNSQTIVVVYTSNAAALAGDTIRVRFTSGCGLGTIKATKLTNTAIGVPAAPTVTVTSVATNVCGARKYRYSASALVSATTTTGGASGWLWSLPEGPVGSTGTIDSGDVNSQTIVVAYTSNAATLAGDTIRVRFTSGCGLGLVKATKLTNTVLNAPAAPLTITIALVSDKCGERVYRYAAPVLPVATTTAGAPSGYLWSMPFGNVGSTGVLDSSDLTSRVIRIKYSSNAAATTGDTIKVMYTSACGNSSWKAQKLSNVATAVLAAPTTLTGTTSICSIVGTSTAATYTCSAVTNAVSYVWSIPAGAVIDSGINGSKIKLRFISAGANDSIYVQAVGTNGCYGTRKVLKLVTTGCVTPTYSRVENYITPKDPMTVSVYPNPTISSYHLFVKSNNTSTVNARVFDAQGRLVKTFRFNSSETIAFGNELKAGVYLLELREGKQIKTVRVVKY